MTYTRIRHTEIPSSNRLFTDFLYDFERVRTYYGRPPNLDEFERAANEVTLEPSHRQSLVKALRRQNKGCSQETKNLIDLLAKPGTIAVTTGQQVGLFGGPSFSIYKALTAIKTANALRSRGVQAVPVFWLATEDHDLDEVNHVWLLDAENRPSRVMVETLATPNQPVGDVRLTKLSSTKLLESVTAAFEGLPQAEFATCFAAESYSTGVELRSAFRVFFNKLFDRYGLILVDPMDSSLRRLAVPKFRAAIEGAVDLNQELMLRSADLKRSGYHAQCHVTEETSPVFLIQNHIRTSLTIDGEYVDGSQRYPVVDMCALLDEAPERFSPNVLLRPVIQDFLLPTAVYVAGPAESAYLAQAEVLYRRLLGRMPVITPRASLTILDPSAERYLKRYTLGVEDCFQQIENLQRHISGRLIPPDLDKSFQDGENSINTLLDTIAADLAQFDPTLGAALLNARKKIIYQFGKVRSGVARESLRRNEQAGRDAVHLANIAFPNGTLQERSLSVLSFLARHGEQFIDSLYTSVDTNQHDHQVVVI